MPGFVRSYVRIVDEVNRRLGRIIMYFIFVMISILLWSSFSKATGLPSLWTLEMAQFAMVTYYILGGPYSIQLGSNVRMDLFYGEWSVKKKAVDPPALRSLTQTTFRPSLKAPDSDRSKLNTA